MACGKVYSPISNPYALCLLSVNILALVCVCFFLFINYSLLWKYLFIPSKMPIMIVLMSFYDSSMWFFNKSYREPPSNNSMHI